jgi:hypothetical protein
LQSLSLLLVVLIGMLLSVTSIGTLALRRGAKMSETSYERGYRQGIEGKPPASSKTPSNFLFRTIGPAPVWAWLIAAAALGIGVFLWRRNSQQSSAAGASNIGTTGDSQIPQFVNQTYTSVTPPDDDNNGPDIDVPPHPHEPPPLTVKLWGGKVTSVSNNRATVTWHATGANKFRVIINGPGFKNKTTTQTGTTASFTGLHAGHTYVVLVQAIDAAGHAIGQPGKVDIITTRKKLWPEVTSR